MTDQMRNWLTRGAIALGIFVVGLLVGWIARGSSNHSGDQARIVIYKDWRLACPTDTDPKLTCQLASDVVDPRSGQRLAQLTIGRQDDKDGKLILVVSVPLTVLIPPGLGLQIDANTQAYPYATCVASGCVAMVPADDKLLASLGSAKSMALDLTAENGKTVSLPVSVDGYADATKAFNQIEAKRHSWWRRLWS